MYTFTKTDEEETIISNRLDRSTDPDEKSVSTSGAPKGKGYKEKALATLLYAELYEGLDVLAAGQIRDRMKSTRIKRADRINVSDVPARAGHCAHNPNGSGWSLTPSGRNHIRELLELLATDIEKQQDISRYPRNAPVTAGESSTRGVAAVIGVCWWIRRVLTL